METREDGLARQLYALPVEEVVSFQTWLDRMMQRTYRWDLWAGAYILGGGCSDDCFMDFRSCVIAHGREMMERVLADPDSLAEFVERETVEEEWLYEGYLYVPADIYEDMTDGGEMPRLDVEYADAPAGEPWEENDEVLKQMLPNLWAKMQGGA